MTGQRPSCPAETLPERCCEACDSYIGRPLAISPDISAETILRHTPGKRPVFHQL